MTDRSEIPARRAASARLAASRNQDFSRPLASFAGTYTHPGYGDIVWTERDGKLWYSFEAYSGPASVFDAPVNQLMIVLRGDYMVAEFRFDEGDLASQVMVSDNCYSGGWFLDELAWSETTLPR